MIGIMKTIGALVLSLCLVSTAHAAPVTFAFTGVINSAPISGRYTFESTAPLNDMFGQAGGRVTFFGSARQFSPAPLGLGQWIASANSAITSATINWDGQTGSLDSTSLLAYEPRYGASGITAYNANYAATVHVQGLTGYDYFGLSVEGPLETSARLSQLPTLPPSLNGAPAPVARLELFQRGTFNVVQGTLNSLTLVATPLPGAVWLMGSALVALIGLSARNWRRREPNRATIMEY